MASEQALLDAWRDGDTEAGAALFSRYFEPVYRFFRHKLSGDTDDFVQRTFLAVVEARVRLREGSSFRSYLFACARNVLFEHLRGLYREPAQLDGGVTSLHDLGTSPSGVLRDRQERGLLLSALRRIPLDEQITVELYYWEGMSGREVADALEVPEGTVRTRLRNARRKLAKHLAELHADPEQIASTLDGLERWAEGMRAQLDE